MADQYRIAIVWDDDLRCPIKLVVPIATPKLANEGPEELARGFAARKVKDFGDRDR